MEQGLRDQMVQLMRDILAINQDVLDLPSISDDLRASTEASSETARKILATLGEEE